MAHRLSPSELLLRLPPMPDYAIAYPETIGLRVPADVVVSRAVLDALQNLEVQRTLVSRAAELSGSLVARGSEALLRSPGEDVYVLITIVNDTFAPLAGTQDVALIAGFAAEQAETGGWSEQATPSLRRDLDLYLVDEHTLRLGIPQVPTYDITMPETVTLTVPGALLASRTDLVATPPLVLLAEAGSCSVSGTLLTQPTEAALHSGVDVDGHPLTLRIRLTHDTWAAWGSHSTPYAGLPAADQDIILSGFASRNAADDSSAARTGWNGIIAPLLLAERHVATEADCYMQTFNATHGGVYRWVRGNSTSNSSHPDEALQLLETERERNTTHHWFNDTLYEVCPTVYSMTMVDSHTVDITLPPIGRYAIDEPETVTLVLASSVVTSGRSIEAWPPISLLPARGFAELLSSSSLLDVDESEIRTNSSMTLAIRLTGDQWVADDMSGAFTGMMARQSDSFGWNAIVQPRLGLGMAALSDNSTLVITLPSFSEYDIRSTETVVFTIPPNVVRSRQRPLNHLQFVVNAIAGGAFINGSVTDGLQEQSIRSLAAGEITFTVHLVNETYEPSLGVSGGAGDALILSMTSAQSESMGFANIVQPGLSNADLRRIDDETLRVTIPHFPSFSIDAPETITVSLPPVTLLSRATPIVAGSFVILADAGTAYVSGGFLSNLSTSVLAAYPQTLRLTLADESWSNLLMSGDEATATTLLGGLRSEQSETNGFNSAVVPLLNITALTVTDAQHAELTLPVASGYALEQPETLLWVLPGESVRSGTSISASPSFVVLPAAASASLSSPGLEAAGVDENIFASATRPTVRITIAGDTFHPSVGNATDTDDRTSAVLRSVFALQSEQFGFNAAVQPLLTRASLVRLSDTTVEITIPQTTTYDIDAPETIMCVVPGIATRATQDIPAPQLIEISPEPGTAALSGGIFGNNTEPSLQRTWLQPETYRYNSSARVSGSLAAQPEEAHVRAGGATILIELYEDRFVRGQAVQDASTIAAVISAMRSSSGHWETAVRPNLTPAHATFQGNGTVLNLTLPANGYALMEPEILTVELPASVLEHSSVPVLAAPQLRILAEPSTVELLGPLTVPFPNMRAHHLRAPSGPGNLTLRISGTHDGWLPSLLPSNSTDNELFRDLARGIRSVQAQATGWDAIVQPALVSGSRGIVWNIDEALPTDLTIVLPQVLGYDIAEPETIFVTVPSSMLRSGRAERSSALHFVVAADGAQSVSFESVNAADGWLNASEIRRAPGITMRIQVHGDAFVNAFDLETSQALIDAVSSSASNEPSGWASIIAPALRARAREAVTRVDRHSVVISVPPVRGYHITQPETLSVALPAELLLANLSAAATAPLVITPSDMDLQLTGDIVVPFGGVNETFVRSLGQNGGSSTDLTVVINHYHEGVRSRWPLGFSTTSSEALLIQSLRGCRTCDPGAMTWYRTVPIGSMTVNRVDNHTVTIQIPTAALASYDISTPETVQLAVPSSAICNDRLCADCPCSETGVLPDLVAPPLLIRANGGTATASLRLDSLVLDVADLAFNVTSRQLRNAQQVSLTFNLDDERWADAIGDELLLDRGGSIVGGNGGAVRALMLSSSMVAAASQSLGWTELADDWQAGQSNEPQMLLHSNTSLTVSWREGFFSTYAPRAPETVLLRLPGEAVSSGLPLALGQFVITVDPGTVSMSGALVVQAGEDNLRGIQGHALEFSLVDDTWLPSIGLDGPASAALLRGLASAQQEALGFNAIVQPALTSADLVRLDGHTVRLTIPQRAGYDISAPETLRLTVPPEATFAAHSLAANEQIMIMAAGGIASLTGTLTDDRQARTIRVQSTTLVVTLQRDTWVDALWDPPAHPLVAGTLINAIAAMPSSASVEIDAWDQVVQPALDASMLTRLDNYTMVLTLPALPAYQLVGPSETVQIHLPPELLTSDQPVLVQPALEIVRSDSVPLRVSLVNDAWQREVGSDDVSSTALLAGLRAIASIQTNGWNGAR